MCGDTGLLYNSKIYNGYPHSVLLWLVPPSGWKWFLHPCIRWYERSVWSVVATSDIKGLSLHVLFKKQRTCMIQHAQHSYLLSGILHVWGKQYWTSDSVSESKDAKEVFKWLLLLFQHLKENLFMCKGGGRGLFTYQDCIISKRKAPSAAICIHAQWEPKQTNKIKGRCPNKGEISLGIPQNGFFKILLDFRFSWQQNATWPVWPSSSKAKIIYFPIIS